MPFLSEDVSYCSPCRMNPELSLLILNHGVLCSHATYWNSYHKEGVIAAQGIFFAVLQKAGSPPSVRGRILVGYIVRSIYNPHRPRRGAALLRPVSRYGGVTIPGEFCRRFTFGFLSIRAHQSLEGAAPQRPYNARIYRNLFPRCERA